MAHLRACIVQLGCRLVPDSWRTQNFESVTLRTVEFAAILFIPVPRTIQTTNLVQQNVSFRIPAGRIFDRMETFRGVTIGIPSSGLRTFTLPETGLKCLAARTALAGLLRFIRASSFVLLRSVLSRCRVISARRNFDQDRQKTFVLQR
ncbi:MAG: hypothetical protein KDA79_09330 [Planctomycetaceae bacterium]|nr:hypothetical protein [Planctomycetaceae bacterium]